MISGALEFRPGWFACPGPALWLQAAQTLFLADLHLGYAWAQRRRGQLGPILPGDARARVNTLLQQLRPRCLAILGDLVHAPRPAPAERAEIEATISEFAAQTELILVRGNHDRAFLRDFSNLPLPTVPVLHGSGFVAVHGDSPHFPWPENATAIFGHWHPAASLRDAAGATLRYPAFLVWPRAIVLPAFTPFSAGLDIRRGIPHALRALAGASLPPQCLAVTSREVIPLNRVSRSRSNSSLKGAS